MTIDEIIAKLKSLQLDTNPEKEVKELIGQVGNIGYMLVIFHKGKSIMRARPNDDSERFSKKEDFSYKPQRLNTNYQRASTPNQTMFYGCVLPDNIEQGELQNSRIIGVLESLPWLRDKKSSGYKKISFGKWLVQEDINLIAIIHQDTYYGESNYTRELVNAYDHFSAQEDKELVAKSLKFQRFLAEEFSKEITTHFDYLISAIFTEIVTTNPKLKIDGIIYPSVRVLGKGFNVAITPDACSKLGLYVAGECSVYKLKGNTIVGNDCLVELDGKTDEFELIEIQNHRNECLQKLGVTSIDDLK